MEILNSGTAPWKSDGRYDARRADVSCRIVDVDDEDPSPATLRAIHALAWLWERPWPASLDEFKGASGTPRADCRGAGSDAVRSASLAARLRRLAKFRHARGPGHLRLIGSTSVDFACLDELTGCHVQRVGERLERAKIWPVVFPALPRLNGFHRDLSVLGKLLLGESALLTSVPQCVSEGPR
jgi:hypothetical protein